MDIKDSFKVDVQPGDKVAWRSKRGFRVGVIEHIVLRTRGNTFIVQPLQGFGGWQYPNPLRVEHFIKVP